MTSLESIVNPEPDQASPTSPDSALVPGSSENATHIELVMHLDTLCPWSYIQKRTLEATISKYETAHPGVTIGAVYKPMILHPTLDRACDKRALYEAQIGGQANFPDFLTRLHTAGNPVGITFSLSGRTGPSVASLALSELVLRRRGPVAQSRVLDRLFAGHFEFGRDISDAGWLAEVGASEDMEADEVRAVVTGEAAAWLVKREAAEARARDGVEAVPCVTVQKRFRIGGYQEAGVFEDLFDRVVAGGSG